MFNNKKEIKKYIEMRKDKISFFGQTPAFDWFFIIILFTFLVILVFVFSISEMKTAINYEPIEEFDANTIIRDRAVIEKLDAIILKYEGREGDVEETIATTTDEVEE